VLVANYQQEYSSIGWLAVNTLFMQMLSQTLCMLYLTQYIVYKLCRVNKL
jgi:hypothetical protein